MPTLANEPAEDRMIGAYPDESGYFGRYGGAFIAETLMGPVKELEEAYARYRQDPEFIAEFEADLRDYVGRPTLPGAGRKRLGERGST